MFRIFSVAFKIMTLLLLVFECFAAIATNSATENNTCLILVQFSWVKSPGSLVGSHKPATKMMNGAEVLKEA